MTRDQQLAAVGVSAEAYEDHIIIEADRRFMTLTPREVEVFYGHLRKAYQEAMRTGREKQREASGALV